MSISCMKMANVKNFYRQDLTIWFLDLGGFVTKIKEKVLNDLTVY